MLKEYIGFSENEELWKEAEHMSGLGQSVLEEGIEQGIEQRDEELIMKKHLKGMPSENIADFLEISLEKVNEVISKKTLKL